MYTITNSDNKPSLGVILLLGERIKTLRKEIGITQEELGKTIGVTTSMIGMYETNARKPSYDVLLKMSEYFNVTTDYLLGKSNPIDIRSYEHIQKRLNSPLAASLLDEDFIKELSIAKRISEDEAEKLMEEILIDNSIKFFDFNFNEWTLVDKIKEEMISNDRSIEENISKATFDIIIDIFNDLNKYDLVSVLKIVKDIKNQYPNIISEISDPKEIKVVEEILSFYIDDNDLTLEDKTLIRKYNFLDDKGKHTVNTVLDMEYHRCNLSYHPLVVAAHEIPGASEEDKAHDDAIMDDDNF